MLGFPRLSVPTLSVRTRIVFLAVIPVVGFLANGIAFTSGETEVEGAFRIANRAAALANAGHGLKAAFATMRISARDFVSKPRDEVVSAFDGSQELAARSLDTIDNSPTEAERADLAGLRDRIAHVAELFAELVNEQRKLGFTDDSGVNLKMRDSTSAIERFANSDLAKGQTAALRQEEALKVLNSMLLMRRFETDY